MDDVKKDRYLFLDIDGVLNSYFGYEVDKVFTKSMMPQKDFFSSQNMMVLKFIVENVKDLKIVISSSWGISHYWRLEEIFNFFEIPLYWDSIKYLKYEGWFDKKNLIKKYCKINNIDIKDIAIFDDEWKFSEISDLDPWGSNWEYSDPIDYRYIEINPHDGLTYTDYEKMAKLFNLEPEVKIR